jgi:hypothetical protein
LALCFHLIAADEANLFDDLTNAKAGGSTICRATLLQSRLLLSDVLLGALTGGQASRPR